MSEVPERVYMDPDIKFPECEKRYGCDIEYVRGDLVEAAVKKLGDSLVAAEAKLAKAVEAFTDLEQDCEADYPPSHGAMKYYIQRALAELKGEQP